MQFEFDTFDPFGDIFGNFFDFVTLIIILSFVFFIVIIIIASAACRGARASSGFTIEPPSFVLPQGRPGTRSDGAQIKTVRLPEVCPHCRAALSHEGIDWVGPMEAKCNYCGGTVKATFENI